MKILSQIDEHKFVIELGAEDERPFDVVRVGHDYVEFDCVSVECVENYPQSGVFGPHRFCHNCVSMRQRASISIREMIKIVMPYLKNHEYLQEEHLDNHGEPWYTYTEGDVVLSEPTGNKTEYGEEERVWVRYKREAHTTDYEKIVGTHNLSCFDPVEAK